MFLCPSCNTTQPLCPLTCPVVCTTITLGKQTLVRSQGARKVKQSCCHADPDETQEVPSREMSRLTRAPRALDADQFSPAANDQQSYHLSALCTPGHVEPIAYSLSKPLRFVLEAMPTSNASAFLNTALREKNTSAAVTYLRYAFPKAPYRQHTSIPLCHRCQ